MIFLIVIVIIIIILIIIFICLNIKFCIHKNKFDQEFNNWWKERIKFQQTKR